MADLGKTTGVFQFESRSIKDWLREIGVETFEHLVAVNALHRPAALKSGYAKKYAKRKNGMEKIDYLHPSLKKPLKRTYGLVVFQEDSMRIAKEVAGYTYEEADDLRKITSKGAKLVASGKGYLFDEAKEIFVKKCIDNGVDKDQASEIFKFIESFMDYAFNRAHAVAYSIISYQCLYLKKYYPLEFLISILNNASKEETLNDYKREVKRMGYELLNPNVNKSSDYFSIDSGGIRYGLSFIKNIGLKASTDIVKMAPYDSFDDFLDKVNRRVVNKGVIESLNKAGAFKCFNDYDESKYLKKVKQQCTN